MQPFVSKVEHTTQLFANIARQGNFVIGSRHSKSSLVLVDRVIHLAEVYMYGWPKIVQVVSCSGLDNSPS